MGCSLGQDTGICSGKASKQAFSVLQATGFLSRLQSATVAQKSHGQSTRGRGRAPIKPPTWTLKTEFHVTSVAPNTVLPLTFFLNHLKM